MHIDFSDEQAKNAESGIDRSLASDSNVTEIIEMQFEKHDLPKNSTERGITIDFNEEHRSNADSSMDFNKPSDFNLISWSNLQPLKQCRHRCWIDREISTSESFPNDRTRLMPSKFNSCVPHIRKHELRSAKRIAEMLVSTNAEPSISWTDDGKQIDFSDKQPSNSLDSMRLI
jgi:hypothetical protein